MAKIRKPPSTKKPVTPPKPLTPYVRPGGPTPNLPPHKPDIPPVPDQPKPKTVKRRKVAPGDVAELLRRRKHTRISYKKPVTPPVEPPKPPTPKPQTPPKTKPRTPKPKLR